MIIHVFKAGRIFDSQRNKCCMCSRACIQHLSTLKCRLLQRAIFSSQQICIVHDKQYLITVHQTSASKCSLRGFGIIACLKRNSSHCCQAPPLSLQTTQLHLKTAIRIPRQWQRLDLHIHRDFCSWGTQLCFHTACMTTVLPQNELLS